MFAHVLRRGEDVKKKENKKKRDEEDVGEVGWWLGKTCLGHG